MFKRLTLAGMMAVALSAHAQALTKPTDVVNVYYPQEHLNKPPKVYSKPWSAVVMDTATKQKILGFEKKLEKEHQSAYRVYAIRLTPRTNGDAFINYVLFLGRFGAVAYDVSENVHCLIDLTANGSVVSGSKCQWL